ncbi:MAG: hypothetical protein VW879_01915 [Opitutae bacterium]
MTITTRSLIDYLKRYNKWRRGADMAPPDPSELGEVIDVACDTLEDLQKNKDNNETLNEPSSSVVKELKRLLREMGERPEGGGGMIGEYSLGRREARAQVRKLLRDRIKFHSSTNTKEI